MIFFSSGIVLLTEYTVLDAGAEASCLIIFFLPLMDETRPTQSFCFVPHPVCSEGGVRELSRYHPANQRLQDTD